MLDTEVSVSPDIFPTLEGRSPMNKNITRSMLLDSFIFGKPITLYVHGRGDDHTYQGIVKGQVVGLSPESGFYPPKPSQKVLRENF
jgi:hypothetical protein